MIVPQPSKRRLGIPARILPLRSPRLIQLHKGFHLGGFTNGGACIRRGLKELRHDILGHFFDGVSHGLSVGKPKTNDLLMKKKTKGVILKQKGTRMAEDGED